MKLVSYLSEGRDQLAFLVDGYLFDCDMVHPELPSSMNMFLQYWDDMFPIAQQVNAAIKDGRIGKEKGIDIQGQNLLAPVPFPTSCRDGYAFRQHVAAARRNRKVEMIPEFDQYPIFYFTNHHSIQGPGDIYCMPDHFEKLDFELEAAIVICKSGKNIPAEEADQYIGGLMIMNDMSARRLQMEEMLLNLGPAKGKDFSTVIGPCLVTLDELEAYEIPAKPGHTGKNWNLGMKCWVNGVQVSEGNIGDMDWTFAEIIERCAYGVQLHPGDVIGSGTVGTGCFLELNGTGKLNDPHYQEQWLQPGDTVTMEIEGIGILENKIVKEDTDFSILARKKGN
ncbi:MAG: fumarylacetoacetate hydrolase family protein [Sediminibacterium sp. Gen4]|uniref:fumarylacetoacetate hydrolase family protein n=1 Tax=unclassified Sediminibacterium TaxID=2635961 RepID=UPI0015BD3B1B|nr:MULTISPECIES: fumarylacetoacetate hydrolase family protein [unclassified Sediminibacterium]MBW0162335.1 fumarylacetoacetate hydrolase family protein [Sediminibacterium sp.]MBW0164349.1 fumarylacetoacetate hydrolase family protein [Sediminibacterium sp.]NWK65222.1 fumarylacetoacetate hydrolase family protein [Sediminibacterium sp. Gen4]